MPCARVQEAYNRCLNAADRAGNEEATCKAHYHMGMLYHQHKKWTVGGSGFDQPVPSGRCSTTLAVHSTFNHAAMPRTRLLSLLWPMSDGLTLTPCAMLDRPFRAM